MAEASNESTPLGSEWPTVPLDVASAQVFADQLSIIQDLRFVQACCGRLLSILAQAEDERDVVLLKALWSSAMVAYARCFSSGKRFGLSKSDVESLPLEGEVTEFHTWLIDMRNKHVAHSVNPFEIVKVGAVLSPPDRPQRQVEGVAALSMNYILPDEAGVRQLGSLAVALTNQTREKARIQESKVLADARKLNIDELCALQSLRTYAPPPDAAARPRSKTD